MKSPDITKLTLRNFITARTLCALLLGAVGFGFAATAQAQTAELEYRVINAKLQNQLLANMLNQQAAQGWELLQIERGVAIFVRKKK